MENITKKIAKYQAYVEQVLERYSQYEPYWPDADCTELEVQTIFDTRHHHYQLVQTGWRELIREYGCIVHMDIKPDGKIWIQYDGTANGLADEHNSGFRLERILYCANQSLNLSIRPVRAGQNPLKT